MSYKNPALTVDALVAKMNTMTRKLQVLLIQRGKEPFKDHYAFPGGFVDYGEDPVKAVVRELQEETHLKSEDVPELVSVKGNPMRDPRQHTVTIAYAVKITSDAGMKGDDDAKDAKWFNFEEVLEQNVVKLAFDHLELCKEFYTWIQESPKSDHYIFKQ